MSPIRVLPVTVQNQIAAGEVVERPAAVVKELVENAIDAGATRILVDIEEGGRRLIRVADDGQGMGEEDLHASILRHATSKIQTIDDIHQVATMGFRGEALPSIASVSRLRITTAPPDAAIGHELTVEGGVANRLSPAPPRRGTIVEVRDLFYNTPARAAFLSSPAAETAAAVTAMIRLALGRRDIAFTLHSGGKRLLDAPAADDPQKRIGALFGQALADGLAILESQSDDGAIELSGYMASPATRHAAALGRTGKDIHTFVNRRWIRHPGMPKVIQNACEGRIPPRHYPFTVMWLRIQPDRVDVNVHPAKMEARFREVGKVMRVITAAVERVMGTGALPGGSRSGGARPPPPGSAAFARRGGEGLAARQPVIAPRSAMDAKAWDTWGGGGNVGGQAKLSFQRREAAPAGGPGAVERPEAPPAADPAEGDWLSAGGHRVVGQVGQKYLAIENADGLLLVDPHALHERWIYDRLREGAAAAAPVDMLLPVIVPLSPDEAVWLEAALPALAEMGFDARALEDDQMAIHAAPAWMPPDRLPEAIKEYMARLCREEGQPKGRAADVLRESLEKSRKSMACRSAVLLGRRLSDNDMCRLLDMLRQSGEAPTCPHGRPAAWLVSWAELSRRLGR